MPGRAIAVRLGRDGAAGIFIVATGVVLWLIVRNYPRGELSQFGPGYLPWIASIGMMLLGAAIVAKAYLSANNAHEAQAVSRSILIVPLGMLVFAFGLEVLGLFVTSALGVFVTTFASRESTLIERVLLALGLATLVTVVFGYGIGMTVPLAPPFLRP